MAFADLRTFIDGAARIGELKIIDGAHWNLEIGCLTELMAEQEGPLLLFDNIVDYPAGFRIATNVLASPRRFALALGLPTDVPKLEILKAWRNKTRDLKPFAPVEVSSGPVTREYSRRRSHRSWNFSHAQMARARRRALYRHRRHGDYQRSGQRLDQRRHLPLLRR